MKGGSEKGYGEGDRRKAAEGWDQEERGRKKGAEKRDEEEGVRRKGVGERG